MGMAHDAVYGTSIEQGVIMMCSKDGYYQQFMIEGEEFRDAKHKFWGDWMNSTVVWIITAMLWYQGPVIMDTRLTKQNSLMDVVSALITFGTTKQTWLKSCLEYMASMKMDVGSRHGASTVKQRALTSTKCDIFATPSNPYYSGDLTPLIFFIFIFFKIIVVMVDFKVSI